MKSFVYTYSERTPRNGHTEKTVRIFQVVRNTPVFIGMHTETFVSEFQLFMIAAEHYKILPKKAFERNQFGGYVYGAAHSMRGAGIANVNQVY